MSCASAAAVAARPKQSIAVPIARFMVNSTASVCLARASTNAYEARSPLVRRTHLRHDLGGLALLRSGETSPLPPGSTPEDCASPINATKLCDWLVVAADEELGGARDPHPMMGECIARAETERLVAPYMPDPTTTASKVRPLLPVASAQMLHRYRPRASIEGVVRWTSIAAAPSTSCRRPFPISTSPWIR